MRFIKPLSKTNSIVVSFFCVVLVLGILCYGFLEWHENRELKKLSAGTLTLGDTTIVVEVSSNSLSRSHGLSNRTSLGDGEGMLFVFPKEGFYHFWMKDMLISLDTIWMDSKWKVVDVRENISPSTYPETYTSKEKAQYALEVTAGFVKRHGVSVGEQVVFESH